MKKFKKRGHRPILKPSMLIWIMFVVFTIFPGKTEGFYLEKKESINEKVVIKLQYVTTQKDNNSYMIYDNDTNFMDVLNHKTFIHPHSDRFLPFDKIELNIGNLRKYTDTYNAELTISSLINANIEVKKLYDEYLEFKENAKKELAKASVPFYDNRKVSNDLESNKTRTIYSQRRKLLHKKSLVISGVVLNKNMINADDETIKKRTFYSPEVAKGDEKFAEKKLRKNNSSLNPMLGNKGKGTYNKKNNGSLVMRDRKSVDNVERDDVDTPKEIEWLIGFVSYMTNNKIKVFIIASFLYLFITFIFKLKR